MSSGAARLGTARRGQARQGEARVLRDNQKEANVKSNQAKQELVKVFPDIAQALEKEERFNVFEVINRFKLDPKMGRHVVWQAVNALLKERRIDFRPVKGGGGNYERVHQAK